MDQLCAMNPRTPLPKVGDPSTRIAPYAKCETPLIAKALQLGLVVFEV